MQVKDDDLEANGSFSQAKTAIIIRVSFSGTPNLIPNKKKEKKEKRGRMHGRLIIKLLPVSENPIRSVQFPWPPFEVVEGVGKRRGITRKRRDRNLGLNPKPRCSPIIPLSA